MPCADPAAVVAQRELEHLGTALGWSGAQLREVRAYRTGTAALGSHLADPWDGAGRGTARRHRVVHLHRADSPCVDELRGDPSVPPVGFEVGGWLG